MFKNNQNSHQADFQMLQSQSEDDEPIILSEPNDTETFEKGLDPDE
jgi:hypothetical protein